MLRCLFIVFTISFSSTEAALIKIVQANPAGIIKYFKPFDNFPNINIPIELKPDENGKVMVEIFNEAPVMVKFIIGQASLWLLVEPNDTINIQRLLKMSEKHLSDTFIAGNNFEGHVYYNKIFNNNPHDKFEGLRGIFERSQFDNVQEFTKDLESEFTRQLQWIDSLNQAGKITSIYSEYMQTEIRAVLAWEVGNLCEASFANKVIEQAKYKEILSWLFNYVNPHDKRMYSCGLARNYYYTYYHATANQTFIDTARVIVPETFWYANAPTGIQKAIWGSMLWAYKTFAPSMYDYEQLYTKYKLNFKDGDYIKYFDSTSFFKTSKDLSKYHFIETKTHNLFSLINENFRNKRLLIDLWATWCAPCKAEFAHYSGSIQQFLIDRQVSVLFLSLDEPEDKDKWMKEIVSLQLYGNHALVKGQLLQSVKDIVYENGSTPIPRYILVNENGQIISTDFLRPSHPEFRSKIEAVFPRNLK